MNKQQLWDAFLEKYPQFRDEESIVKQRSRGLRRLLDQAWDEGFKRGKEVSSAMERLKDIGRKSGPFGF